MTFTKTNMQYRVAFDTTSNRFMAIDAQTKIRCVWYYNRQAVRALTNLDKSEPFQMATDEISENQ